MKITEIFYSIQGEGISIGLPAVFVRTTGCNLSCFWCDTQYAQIEGKEMTIAQVMAEIETHTLITNDKQLINRRCNRIIITGGEPLLQMKEVEKFVSELKQQKYQVEIETNGTIQPTKTLQDLIDVWTISPKTLTQQAVLPILKWGIPNHKLYLKFVIDNEKDLLSLIDIMDTPEFDIKGNHVFLMPQSIGTAAMFARLPMIIEFAKTFDLRVTPRLQVLAYGNERGK